jgi:hypothetical protein
MPLPLRSYINNGPCKKSGGAGNLRKYHKWPALAISFFLLIFAMSGIVLNHRELFSGVDISRKWLPPEYTFKNWNLASVKSALRMNEDSILVYGNIGIWLTDDDFSTFSSFTEGFPGGVDNRKIFAMLQTSGGYVFAGARSGLYRLDRKTGRWETIRLPVNENGVIGMVQKGDSILIMTRSDILFSSGSGNGDFQRIDLPPAADDDGRVSLFRTIWLVHSGKIFGTAGKIVTDLMAGVLVFLILSGWVYWLTPGVLKRAGGTAIRSLIKRTNRYLIRWHNTLGYLTVVFLMLISVTGIFLRPPLLIPIAGISVPVIKNSWLDNPNPWFDKLRDILWDEEKNIFICSTSEGLYYTGPEFSGKMQPFFIEPPVSVMGVNVLEKLETGEYLVGSFSGIFRWTPGFFPDKGAVINHLTGIPEISDRGLSAPFGNTPVSGRLIYEDREIIFDYLKGAISTGYTEHNRMEKLSFRPHSAVLENSIARRSGKVSEGFVEMPEEIIAGTPISLWNLALEVHTGRIFYSLVGNFYILYVPVAGILSLVVLGSGFLIWLRKRNSRRMRPDRTCQPPSANPG